MPDVAAGQFDGQLHARFGSAIAAREIHLALDPLGQAQFNAQHAHGFAPALFQVSRRVTTRLNTGRFGW